MRSQHSCSGVGEKQNLIALFWEVISEARKIFQYMSKRCPKKPHSLQSYISMFWVQHWQLPKITHMVLFDLTDFYYKYRLAEVYYKTRNRHLIRILRYKFNISFVLNVLCCTQTSTIYSKTLLLLSLYRIYYTCPLWINNEIPASNLSIVLVYCLFPS